MSLMLSKGLLKSKKSSTMILSRSVACMYQQYEVTIVAITESLHMAI